MGAPEKPTGLDFCWGADLRVKTKWTKEEYVEFCREIGRPAFIIDRVGTAGKTFRVSILYNNSLIRSGYIKSMTVVRESHALLGSMLSKPRILTGRNHPICTNITEFQVFTTKLAWAQMIAYGMFKVLCEVGICTEEDYK